MSELKTYTEEELAEHQQLYDEVFTPVWESEGQYCRAGGGQYEKSFAWWAFKYQQSKVDELHKISVALNTETIRQREQVAYYLSKNAELQKRVDELQTAFKQLIEMENESISFEHDLFDKGWNQSARQTIENIYKLTGLGEQALKGGLDE